MRTITIKVKVDDYLPETLNPSIDGSSMVDAPVGRVFLCSNGNGSAKRLLQISQMTELAGKRRYFSIVDLPEYMRIVNVGNPDDDTSCDYGPEGLTDHGSKPAPKEQSQGEPECITPATLRDDHFALTDAVCGLLKVVDFINANVLDILENQNTANTVGHDILRALPELEDRMKEHVQQCCDKGTLTTQQYAESIGSQLAKITGTAPQPSAIDDVSPQALLKALEIVSRTILSSTR